MPPSLSIAIVMAMRAEANPVVERLGLSGRDGGDERLPFHWHTGQVGDSRVIVAVNGIDPRHSVDNIGTNHAVLNTWLTLQRWRPDVVISAGTAGGFVAEGGRLGDIYLSTGDFVFHDRRVAIPGFDEAAHGRYPSADVTDLATALGAKLGVISTSNSLDRPDLDIEIMASHGAAVKEMEAAAVAWVCWLAGTPMFAVKSITDLVDSPADIVEEFTTNLARATENLAVAVGDLIPLLPEAALFDD